MAGPCPPSGNPPSTHALGSPSPARPTERGGGGTLPKRPWGSDWRLPVLPLVSLCFFFPLRLPKRFIRSCGHRSGHRRPYQAPRDRVSPRRQGASRAAASASRCGARRPRPPRAQRHRLGGRRTPGTRLPRQEGSPTWGRRPQDTRWGGIPLQPPSHGSWGSRRPEVAGRLRTDAQAEPHSLRVCLRSRVLGHPRAFPPLLCERRQDEIGEQSPGPPVMCGSADVSLKRL